MPNNIPENGVAFTYIHIEATYVAYRRYRDPKAEARHFFDITWAPPANIQLFVGAIQGEGSLDLKDRVGQYDRCTTTPETTGTTHYWFATRRNPIEDDGAFNKMKIKPMHDPFVNEDFPIIETVGKEMDGEHFFDLKPVLMSNDIAPVKVRKLLQHQNLARRGLIWRRTRVRECCLARVRDTFNKLVACHRNLSSA